MPGEYADSLPYLRSIVLRRSAAVIAGAFTVRLRNLSGEWCGRDGSPGKWGEACLFEDRGVYQEQGVERGHLDEAAHGFSGVRPLPARSRQTRP